MSEDIITTRLRPGDKFTVLAVDPADSAKRYEIAVTVVEGDTDEVVSSLDNPLRMNMSVASAQALLDRTRSGGTAEDDEP